MSLAEWHERSFFLELKPRAEFASLFVDCPPRDDASLSEEVVRVGEHELEIRACGDDGRRWAARIHDLSMRPSTVCAPTWADQHRLFMCKVQAEGERLPILPKTFHRLAHDIETSVCLDEYVEAVAGGPLRLSCSHCRLLLFSCAKNEFSMECLPEDDWLSTSQGLDYFCRDSCGAHCDPNTHAHSQVGLDEGGARWLPTLSKIVLAHTFVLLHKENATLLDGKILRCSGCNSELGSQLKNHPEIYEFHHSVAQLSCDPAPKDYIEYRFSTKELFFALCILSGCDSQTSLKLVIRSLDRTPALLLWLLDSYVVLTNGDLNSAQDFRPFPALKLLYKVFDAKSAASDPRANGDDASVGIVDVPFGFCTQLTESLLRSSHALPPACRSVGFLKLNESL